MPEIDLKREFARIAALMFVFGTIFGIVAGSVIHDWLYHQGAH